METLTAFLDRLASADPTPGGGAAAALTGAMAAALVSMACRVTNRRAPSEALVAVANDAEHLRRRLLTLMKEDIEAYESVLESRRAEPDRRGALMQAALRRATTVPLDTASAVEDVLELCATTLDGVRASTIGDLGVAVALGGAALDAAMLTARINLREIADEDFATAARGALARLASGAAAGRGLARRVEARARLADAEGGGST
jgi:formiminotetrahydrofolate cyclodeaminase